MESQPNFDAYKDSSGRITRLPSKHSRKIALSLWLLEKVEFGVEYNEKQINDLFYATVDDFAFIRRTLVDMGYLSRDRDGANYRRVAKDGVLAG